MFQEALFTFFFCLHTCVNVYVRVLVCVCVYVIWWRLLYLVGSLRWCCDFSCLRVLFECLHPSIHIRRTSFQRRSLCPHLSNPTFVPFVRHTTIPNTHSHTHNTKYPIDSCFQSDTHSLTRSLTQAHTHTSVRGARANIQQTKQIHHDNTS